MILRKAENHMFPTHIYINTCPIHLWSSSMLSTFAQWAITKRVCNIVVYILYPRRYERYTYIPEIYRAYIPSITMTITDRYEWNHRTANIFWLGFALRMSSTLVLNWTACRSLHFIQIPFNCVQSVSNTNCVWRHQSERNKDYYDNSRIVLHIYLVLWN